jgi:hypothetical protein
MDLNQIGAGLAAISAALSLAKQVASLLPGGPNKVEIDERIGEAEEKLLGGKAQLAQGLGHELCRDHFPPVPMLSPDNRKWRCPECDNTRQTGPPADWGEGLKGKSRWDPS